MDIVKFLMISEKVFDSPGRKSENGKSFLFIKFYVFNGQGGSQFGVGGRNNSVEVLKNFFNGDFEREIETYEFERMYFCDGEAIFFFRRKFFNLI